MFNIQSWLDETIPDVGIRKDFLCFLLYANGGNIVYGWGTISKDPYGHQIGLEQNEAIQLINYIAFVSGLEAAGCDFSAVFDPIYDEYVKKVENKI